MATGSHGVRFQYDYTHDQPGLPGRSPAASPRWLRLTRTGDTAHRLRLDQRHDLDTRSAPPAWPGCPPPSIVGLFVTSPVSFQGSSGGAATQATATFDHVTLERPRTRDTAGRATASGPARRTSTRPSEPAATSAPAPRSSLSGSGDIAPGVVGLARRQHRLRQPPVRAHRRADRDDRGRGDVHHRRIPPRPDPHHLHRHPPTGLGCWRPRRSSSAPSPSSIGALAAAVAIPLGEHVLNANGNYVFPTSTLTDGAHHRRQRSPASPSPPSAVLALGTILRKSAGAVTAGIVVFVLPYILGSVISGSARSMAVPAHPGRRLLRPRALPRLRAGQLPLHPGQRLLPARPLGRPRRPVRLRRPRPRHSPPACSAAETHDRRAARRVDQAAHPAPAPAGCSSATVALTVAVSAAVAAATHQSRRAAARTPPSSP